MPIEPPWLAEALTPQDDDSDDVRWALESAAVEWTRGDKDQTLKWLIHASTVAAHQAHTDRAGALADAAEELAVLNVRRAQSEPPHSRGSARDYTAALPPSPPFPATDLAVPEIDERPTRLSGTTVALASVAPYVAPRAGSEPPERPTNPVPAFGAAEDASTRVEVPAAELMEAATASSRPVPTPHAGPPAIVPTSHAVHSGSDTAVDETIVVALEEPSSRRGPAPTLESEALFEPMRALRVAVLAGARRSTFVLLAEGEQPPTGAQLAILVPLSPIKA